MKKKILIQSNYADNEGFAWKYIHQTFFEVANRIQNDTKNPSEVILSFTKLINSIQNQPVIMIEMPPVSSGSLFQKIASVFKVARMKVTNLVLIDANPIGIEYLLLRLLRIKVVIHYHRFVGSKSGFLKKCLKSILLNYGLGAHQYIFVSHAQEKKFIECFNKPRTPQLTVSYNAFVGLKKSEEILNDEIDAHKKLIMMDCRASKEKGLEIFLKALFLLDDAILDTIQVVIIGDGPDLSYFKELAATLNLTKCVSFKGEQPLEYVHHFKERAYFVVCCSQFEDPLPLSAFEAIAMGVPVIASKRGGLVEIVLHGVNGLLYEAYDNPYSLKCEMEILIKDDALRNKLAGQKLLQNTHFTKFSFAQRMDELKTLYFI